jgi:cytochrome P450
LLTRLADVQTVLSCPHLSSSPLEPGFPVLSRARQFRSEGPDAIWPIIDMDPPDHSRFRRLGGIELTPKRVARLEPWIAELVDGLLDAMNQRGSPIDLIAAFTSEVPSQVICQMLGFPPGDRKFFLQLAEEIRLDQTSEEERQAAYAQMNGYLDEQAERRDGDRGDEFIDRLLEARDRGEIKPADVTKMARTFYSAAFANTANSLAIGAAGLMSRPDQVAHLCSDECDLDAAVDEIQRWASVVPGVARTTTEDIEVRGQRIAKGEGIICALPAANHDPDAIDRPDELDLTRPRRSFVAFGHGLHQCPGQHLVRAELRIALPALFRRFPALELIDASSVGFKKNNVHSGVPTMVVRW